VIQVALLRDLCGSTLAEAGAQTGTSASGAYRRYARHQQHLSEDEDYARWTTELVGKSMARCHGLQRQDDVAVSERAQ
jgi:hypothetical protein